MTSNASETPALSPMAQLGQYRLLRRIGVGGMAEVYEAELSGSDGFTKRLAIKVLLPHRQRDPEVVKSFIDEATIAAALSHPNIVAVYDFGQCKGINYMAMEYVDGWDLEQLLYKSQQVHHPFPVTVAVYVVRELALALQYIHTRQRSIVHRDATPHNVFVSRDGHVKLSDFGVAKTEARLAQTVDGQIKGKLAYLSPEQARGDTVDVRTDVYGAALILFELVTGRRYNDGASEAAMLAKAVQPTAVRPSTLVPEAAPLDAILESALQPHAAQRTRDAQLLAQQLATYLKVHPCESHEVAVFAQQLKRGTAAGQSDSRTTHPQIGAPTLVGGSSPDAAREVASALRSDVSAPSPTLRLEAAVSSPRIGRWAMTGLATVVVALLATGMLWYRGRPRIEAAVDGQVRAEPSDARSAPIIADTAMLPIDAEVGHAAELDATTVEVPRHAMPRRAIPNKWHRHRRAVRWRRRRSIRRSERVHAVMSIDATVSEVEASPPTAPSAEPPEPMSVDEQRRQLRSLLGRAHARGLWLRDDDAFDRHYRTAWHAVEQGSAAAALETLNAYIKGFRIDQHFINRKLRRLEQAIVEGPLSEQERQRLSVESQKVLRLILAERLVPASRRITTLLHQLRPGSNPL